MESLKDNKNKIREKRFSLHSMANAKFNLLAANIEKLTLDEVNWLSLMEDLHNDRHQIITEKQSESLDTLIRKYSL